MLRKLKLIKIEVVEEQNKRMGLLKNRTAKPRLTALDSEAYAEGLFHAKESKLMPEELLKT